jgi:hypothetical protein
MERNPKICHTQKKECKAEAEREKKGTESQLEEKALRLYLPSRFFSVTLDDAHPVGAVRSELPSKGVGSAFFFL